MSTMFTTLEDLEDHDKFVNIELPTKRRTVDQVALRELMLKWH